MTLRSFLFCVHGPWHVQWSGPLSLPGTVLASALRDRHPYVEVRLTGGDIERREIPCALRSGEMGTVYARAGAGKGHASPDPHHHRRRP